MAFSYFYSTRDQGSSHCMYNIHINEEEKFVIYIITEYCHITHVMTAPLYNAH